MANELTRQMVYKGMKDEIKRIDVIQKELRSGAIEEPSASENYLDPLSADVSKEVKILLSWGGPEDGFKLTFNNQNELIGGVYYMADWGQYQEVALNDTEAQKVFNFYLFDEFPG